jgi:hypothetical protein
VTTTQAVWKKGESEILLSVEKLVMLDLGLERALAAETGRTGYDPRDLLKAVSIRLSESDPLVAAIGS